MKIGEAASKLARAILLTAAALPGTGCHELMMGYREPEWNALARLPDGRRFVTDGRIAMDVTVAEPEELPTATSALWFESALQSHSIAEKQELFTGTDIQASPDNPDVLIGPGGVVLDKEHINYLRVKFSARRLRFWQFRRMEPMVIVIEGKAAGAMKVISQP